jgi:PAS domain S-box-containing protein
MPIAIGSLYILLPLVAAVIAGFLYFRASRYRARPVAMTFSWLMVSLVWWSMTAFLESISPDLAGKTFWMKMAYPGISVLPVAWFIFCAQYVDKAFWLTRRNVAILFVIPFITLVMVGTDHFHHLVWSNIWLDTGVNPPVDAVTHGAWYWIHASYSYILILLGDVFLFRLFLKSSWLYRKQMGIMLLATFIPWIANILYIAQVRPFSVIDPTPLSFAITGIAFFWCLSRLHLLDIIPVAQEAILNSMVDGVIVLDTQQRILEMNPAAERMFGRLKSEAIGRRLDRLLPEQAGLGELKPGVSETQTAVTLGEGPLQRHYRVNLSPISSKQSHNGYVVLLHDDTEHRKAEFEARERVRLETELVERKKAQATLQKSEEKYSTIVEKGNDGIVILQDELVKFANSKMLDIVGYSQSETLDKPFSEFISPEFRNPTLGKYQKRLTGEEFSNKYEIKLLTKNQMTVPVEINANRIEYEGKIANMAIIRDITERKKSEEILKTSEAKYRNLVENVPSGIVTSDMDGLILSANKTDLEIYGFELESELTGLSIVERFANPADRTSLIELLQKKSVAKGFEVVQKRRSGTLFWASLSIMTQISECGQTQFLSVIEDITERKESEQKLISQKELIDRILASTPNAILVIAQDHRILLANKTFCRLLNCEIEKIQGKRIEDITPLNPVTSYIEEVFTGKSRGQRVEFKFNTNELSRVLIADILPMEKEEVLLILLDVTGEREQRERLYLTDRLATIGELAAGIAHELNNPLTGVIGFSQLLMEGDAPPQIKDDLSTINSEAQRAAKIVKNLLTFARKHQPVKQLSQINDCIQETLNIRAYEQKIRNIKIVIHLDPDLPKVMIDYFQMQQVFINIIINAEYFMVEHHNGGTLTITTEKVKETVRVSFMDDGPGIKEEDLKHLFNPFFTTKEVGKGTGLGLAICHGIVSEHQGNIYAQSQLGAGATFVIEIPFSKAAILVP